MKNRSLTSTDSRHLRNTLWLKSFAVVLVPLPSDSMRVLSRSKVTSIGVISGASAFGRDHGGAQRSLGRAERPEGRAVMGFLDPLQNLPADADRRLLGIDLFDFEESLGIMIAKFIAQSKTTLGNGSYTAPFAITDFEHSRY